MDLLASEFDGVLDRRWNSERPLVFIAVVLQKTPTCRRARDVRTRLSLRMDHWERNRIGALVDDTIAELRRPGDNKSPESEETRHRAFNSRVLSGRLRSAVRHLTDRGGGGVLSPDQNCTKEDRPVLEVLQDKHPSQRNPDLTNPDCKAFGDLGDAPDQLPLVITGETVALTAKKLSGAGGPSNVDAVELTRWLLGFNNESKHL